MGRVQTALITDTITVRWLTWFCLNLSPNCSLLPGGVQKFRKKFNQLIDLMELGSLNLSPASLRAGGATYYFSIGVEIQRLRFMGGWRNLCTLDHYVQEASATLVLINLPSEVTGRIESLLREGRFLRRAPVAPWNSFASRAVFSYGLVVPGDFGVRRQSRRRVPAVTWQRVGSDSE